MEDPRHADSAVFDIKGTEIAGRLQGFSADFYGAYLDGALDAARQRLKNN